jgi:hypothetical protein
MSTQTHAMIDGLNMGTRLDDDDPSLEPNGVQVVTREASLIQKALSKIPGCIESPDGSLTVLLHPNKKLPIKSPVSIILRKDARRGDSWFFNVQANPATVFSGDNTYGNLNLKTHVQAIFKVVLDFLETRNCVLPRLANDVVKGNIWIQSITFAQYTKPLAGDVESLIDHWYFMLETRLKHEGKFSSLLQELAIKRSNGDQYDNSISLSIFPPGDKKGQTNKLMHLCVYDKAAEKESREIPMSDEHAADLGSRLRLDLMVTNYFLRNHWGIKNITVRALYDHVRDQGGWKIAVSKLMGYALQRTCLQYMLTVSNPFADKEMVALWEEGKTGRKWSSSLQEWGSKNGINLDVSPVAHLIMLHGQMGLISSSTRLVKAAFTDEDGATRYLDKVGAALKKTKEVRLLAKSAGGLVLDFSTRGPSF